MPLGRGHDELHRAFRDDGEYENAGRRGAPGYAMSPGLMLQYAAGSTMSRDISTPVQSMIVAASCCRPCLPDVGEGEPEVAAGMGDADVDAGVTATVLHQSTQHIT